MRKAERLSGRVRPFVFLCVSCFDLLLDLAPSRLRGAFQCGLSKPLRDPSYIGRADLIKATLLALGTPLAGLRALIGRSCLPLLLWQPGTSARTTHAVRQHHRLCLGGIL
jgi:hypothetical protein